MRPDQEYIQAVKQGRRNAGRLERLAVEHCEKLRRLYEFDENEVERVFNIVSLFKHTKGKWRGKPFDILPHQAFFLAYLFGLRSGGKRLIREAMINMAKKGGKSELDGAIAVLCTFFDGENTAEGYVVANKTDQALFAWESAYGIARQLASDFPDFAGDFKFYHNKQEHKLIQISSGNFFKTLPYESNTLDGVNPHIAIIDEFHEYPDTSVPDNLTSGMVLREQPLLLYSTTRGFHPYGPLAEKEEYYENVLTGLVDDHTVFPLIFSLDDDKKWKNKNYWIQFAPGIDHNLPSYDAIEGEMKKALEEGGEKLVSCKTKNFNMWQRAKASFVDPDAWTAGSSPIDEKTLIGRQCYGAFDLGRNDDISALGYLFPPDDPGGSHVFLVRFFMPEDMIEKRSREQKVSYKQWIDSGLVIPTPGNYTDTSFLVDQFEADAAKFNILMFAGDISFAAELLNVLSAKNFEVQKFPQNYSHMNPAVLKLQSLINARKFQHGGNKVLSWMCSNVTLRRNTGGQVMMDKSDRITGKGSDHKKGRRKIDGMVVAAMCVGLWIDAMKDQESVYNSGDRGFLMLD